MSEVINGISSVKSYGWEKPFFRNITEMRRLERQYLSRVHFLNSITNNLYFSSLSIASFAAFSVYWATNGTLTIITVFSTLSLLQAFKNVFYQCTRAFDYTTAAIHSSKRIEKFLNLSNPVPTNNVNNVKNESAEITYCFDKNEKESQNKDNSLDCAEEDNNNNVDSNNDNSNINNNNNNNNDGDNISDSNNENNNININNDCEVKDPTASELFTNETVLALDSCSFSYPAHGQAHLVLTDLQWSLNKGELLMVVGPVGAGKSSLLSSLLGDMEQRSGKMKLAEKCRIAFCAQHPWIIAGTVRANICIAGKQQDCDGRIDSICDMADALNYKYPRNIDEELYKVALAESRLDVDIAVWDARDLTGIGAKGVSISGGQKARVSLARAVYSDAECT